MSVLGFYKSVSCPTKPVMSQSESTTMTLQDAFDVIWNRSKNKIKSWDDEERCYYRADGKPPCFVGVLIADQFYSSRLEGDNAYAPFVTAAIIKSGYPASDMYSAAQLIHDEFDVDQWECELRKLAKEYNLTVKP